MKAIIFIMTSHQLPQWAPRIKQDLIRRLYESDACGMLDEDLLDEVGWALVHRCRSFIEANAAVRGKAPCPACGQAVRHHSGQDEVLACAACGWSLPWKDYFATIRRRQLSGAEEIVAVFQNYIDTFPHVREPQEKMAKIDFVIHSFHWNALHTPGARAGAVNLIEGNLHDVVQFLNRLSVGPGSTPGVADQRTAWRKVVNEGADYWQDEKLRVKNEV